jgi:hypothetical protein
MKGRFDFCYGPTNYSLDGIFHMCNTLFLIPGTPDSSFSLNGAFLRRCETASNAH